MSKLTGKVQPLKDRVFVSDMNFDMETTAGGIHLLSDNAKSTGIHPRWAKVWAVGPDQLEVQVGTWICIEHGRWTRTIEYQNENKSITELRVVDNAAILMSADEKPDSIMRSAPVGAGSNVNFNVPGM